MKLKRLKLISSIVSVSAFLGAMSLLIFSNVNQKSSVKVNADYSIGSTNGSGSLSYKGGRYGVVEVPINYNTSATYVTNNTQENYVSYYVSLIGDTYFTYQSTTYADTGRNYNPQTYRYDVIDGIFPTSVTLTITGVDTISAFDTFSCRGTLDWYADDTLISTSSVPTGIGGYVLTGTGLDLIDVTFMESLTSISFDLYASNDAQSYITGFSNGYDSGYTDGYGVGYNQGYDNGYQSAVDSMQSELEAQFDLGYVEGYQDGQNEDSTIATIFGGIIQVALVPVNFFLGIFNFEILGINLRAFIQALFTVAITIIVVKAVLGSKGGGGSD